MPELHCSHRQSEVIIWSNYVSRARSQSKVGYIARFFFADLAIFDISHQDCLIKIIAVCERSHQFYFFLARCKYNIWNLRMVQTKSKFVFCNVNATRLTELARTT